MTEQCRQISDLIDNAAYAICRYLSGNAVVPVTFSVSDNSFFVIGSGEQTFALPDTEVKKIICQLDAGSYFRMLDRPIECRGFGSSNAIMPVRLDGKPIGAMLFDLEVAPAGEQLSVLEMVSIQINMAVSLLNRHRELKQKAVKDPLTNLYNRREFDLRFEREIVRMRRNESGWITCCFVDLDNFKQINDTYGHQVGDQVLVQTAKCISGNIRSHDVCARFGGDEFIILLVSDDGKAIADAAEIGKRILASITSMCFADLPGLRVSVSTSIGMATQSYTSFNKKHLIAMADKAVYAAKQGGKGCLRIL